MYIVCICIFYYLYEYKINDSLYIYIEVCFEVNCYFYNCLLKFFVLCFNSYLFI